MLDNRNVYALKSDFHIHKLMIHTDSDKSLDSYAYQYYHNNTSINISMIACFETFYLPLFAEHGPTDYQLKEPSCRFSKKSYGTVIMLKVSTFGSL